MPTNRGAFFLYNKILRLHMFFQTWFEHLHSLTVLCHKKIAFRLKHDWLSLSICKKISERFRCSMSFTFESE